MCVVVYEGFHRSRGELQCHNPLSVDSPRGRPIGTSFVLIGMETDRISCDQGNGGTSTCCMHATVTVSPWFLSLRHALRGSTPQLAGMNPKKQRRVRALREDSAAGAELGGQFNADRDETMARGRPSTIVNSAGAI